MMPGAVDVLQDLDEFCLLIVTTDLILRVILSEVLYPHERLCWLLRGALWGA
jgi:hypothetical protein